MSSRRTVTLLQLNDSHGYLEPHQEIFWSPAGATHRICGGFARMSAIFQRVRQECEGTKLENPAGLRVQDMMVAGEPWQEEGMYPVGFVTEQGVAPHYGRNRRDLDLRAIDALRQYLADQPFRGGAHDGIVAV